MFETRLNDIGSATPGTDVRPVVHHHAGAHVEQPDEIRRWLEEGPEEFELLFDTGHYYAYGDVTEGIECFAAAVVYVHYTPPSDSESHLANPSAGKADYDSIMTYVGAFTDLGEGALDFEDITAALGDVGYDGHRPVEVDTVDGSTRTHAQQKPRVIDDAVCSDRGSHRSEKSLAMPSSGLTLCGTFRRRPSRGRYPDRDRRGRLLSRPE